MPAVTAPSKVLVTGVTGFLGIHVARVLLEKGYTVVGTARSAAKGEYVKEVFSNYQDKFSYLIVEDIEKEDAFDEAVKGVDAVEHTASPFHYKAGDPKEVIGPAVAGTVGVLKSISKNAPSVKRVVITSSVAAIYSPKEGSYTFTESDWNEFSPAEVEKKGKDAANAHKYSASKALAEKAAWNYVKENKVNFDLATINPPFIFGPFIHEVKSLDSLNESVGQFYRFVTSPQSKEFNAAAYGNFVDVRDVATAHQLALAHPEAGGQRFLISAGPITGWQTMNDTLRAEGVANIPEGFPGVNDPAKNPEIGKTIFYNVQSNEKSKRVLGLTYHPAAQTFKDTLEAVRKRFPEAK